MTRRSAILVVSCALVLSAGVAPAFGQKPVKLFPLGDLPGGDYYSYAHGVSPDGRVVVGFSKSSSGTEAFRWSSATGMMGLGDLPGGGYHSEAIDASANGEVVVGRGFGFPSTQGFVWTEAEGMRQLPFPPDDFIGWAHGVSHDGSIIVGSTGGFQTGQGVVWTPDGEVSGIGGFADSLLGSLAFSVSGDGSVVGGKSYHGYAPQACMWSPPAGPPVSVGRLPGAGYQDSVVQAISSDGSTLVGWMGSDQGVQAYRWTAGSGLEPLGDLPGGLFESRAFGVSADGSTIVGQAYTGLGREAFIWKESMGMVRLKDWLFNTFGVQLRWHLEVATAVSDDGWTIAGSGINPRGQTEAWALVFHRTDPLP